MTLEFASFSQSNVHLASAANSYSRILYCNFVYNFMLKDARSLTVTAFFRLGLSIYMKSNFIVRVVLFLLILFLTRLRTHSSIVDWAVISKSINKISPQILIHLSKFALLHCLRQFYFLSCWLESGCVSATPCIFSWNTIEPKFNQAAEFHRALCSHCSFLHAIFNVIIWHALHTL